MSNQHTGKVWHPDDDKELARIFPTNDSSEVAKVFNCSVRVVQNRAHRLGIRKDKVWLAEFKRKIAQESYEKACNSGFKKGNDGHGFGFKKGNVPWNKINPDDEDEETPSRKRGIPTGHGYQVVKEVPGGRVVQHVMRG